MKISTRGQYAVIVMEDLAKYGSEELVHTRDIAARNGISLKYLEQILAVLSKGGCVNSVKGKNGGYRLSKKPSEYTIGDILRVAEGSLEPVNGLDMELKAPSDLKKMENLILWKGLYDVINSYVDSITLDALMKKEKEFMVHNYSI
ncbi:MAG: Rrf2 family transcriptional regulator [Clostridia bacterium]|nr:Rrf2 family transcriptional regulator [Clostridia bacterium]